MREIAESPASAAPGAVRWGEVAVALVALTWILLAAFWAAPASFTEDGFIYQAMLDAFARNGSLFLDNGYDKYRSEALALNYVKISDGGLAPQYPGGWGILGAPVYLLGGIRGIILVNAVAGALTLVMIWITAHALFRDRTMAVTAALIYGVASFAVEYAIGFWPHAVTTFFVSAAVAAAASGWRGETRHEMLGFLVAGLAIGVAVNIRVDAILAVFGLAAWILIAARRPYAGLAMLALGLAPGLAAATWINFVKFGRLSPVTYGSSGGADSLGHYAKSLPVLGAVAIGFLLLGMERVRATLSRPLALGGLLACIAAAVVLVPPLTVLAARLARGAYALVVNFQAIPLPGWGLYPTEQGIITAWGLPKKALLESLPYVAAAVLLLPRLFRGPDRAALALCFLFPLPFFAFFSLNAWHGGGNNMRYFLNAVPALAILSAVALSEITGRLGERSWPSLIAGAATLGGAILYARVQGYPAGFILQHILPTAIMAGLVGLAVVLWLTHGAVQGAAARAMLSLFTIGLATAAVNGWGVDMVTSQHSRARNAEVIEKAAELPTNALIVSSMLEQTPFRLDRPEALTALIYFRSQKIEPDLARLVETAFAEGRPVFVRDRRFAEMFVASGIAADIEPRLGLPEQSEFYRLTLPERARAAQ